MKAEIHKLRSLINVADERIREKDMELAEQRYRSKKLSQKITRRDTQLKNMGLKCDEAQQTVAGLQEELLTCNEEECSVNFP